MSRRIALPGVVKDSPVQAQLKDGVLTLRIPLPEATQPKQIEIKIGVVDSKRNPAGSNYQRYERVRQLVERVLVPLNQPERSPIVTVRVALAP